MYILKLLLEQSGEEIKLMKSLKDLKNFYYGKKVLITGHTGFKGSWLCILMHSLGAKIIGVSIDDKIQNGPYQACDIRSRIYSDIRLDIRNHKELYNVVIDNKPDFVFHLAAQALVSKSYKFPSETFNVNAIGTLNLLEAIKNLNKKISVILITSDKCYENVETFYAYKETDILGGKDPYSASKACAEIIANSYMRSIFFEKENINIATARAGNVIGGGDWSQDRLIPDAVNHWQKNQTLKIRNPNSTRPWQHVFEPINGYLLLGIFLDKNKNKSMDLGANSFNFGPSQLDIYTVKDVIKIFSEHWKNSKFEFSDKKQYEEAGLLNLTCDKANRFLEWKTKLGIKESLLLTSNWYKKQLEKTDMYNFSITQINDFYDK